MLTPEQREDLSKKLNASNVKSRYQYGNSGKRYDYISADHAIRTANAIFGFDGWDCTTDAFTQIQQEQKPKKDSPSVLLWYVGYTAQVTVNALGVVRQGVGFGSGFDQDLGQAHESAIKEAESDALKRALRTFGDQFGLALYDKDREYVEGEEAPPAQQRTSKQARNDASVTAQAPATKSSEVDPEVAEAGKWIRSLPGFTQADYTEFVGLCNAKQKNWVKFALEQKKDGCKSKADLFFMIENLRAA